MGRISSAKKSVIIYCSIIAVNYDDIFTQLKKDYFWKLKNEGFFQLSLYPILWLKLKSHSCQNIELDREKNLLEI